MTVHVLVVGGVRHRTTRERSWRSCSRPCPMPAQAGPAEPSAPSRSADMPASRAINWLVGIGLLVISSAGSLLVAEFGVRLFVDPVDYLLPVVVRRSDASATVWLAAPAATTMGIPQLRVSRQSAEIVADRRFHDLRHLRAREANPGPRILAQLTGKTTYNIGLGGYGPLHYLYLLRERALTLKPKAAGRRILLRQRFGGCGEARLRQRRIGHSIASADLNGAGEQGRVVIGGPTSLPVLDRFRTVNTASTDPGVSVLDGRPDHDPVPGAGQALGRYIDIRRSRRR